MKSINKNELILVKQFNYGSFSHVFEAYYNGKLYCYKQFRRDYPDDILNNICDMTEEEYDVEFAPPLIIVYDNEKIIGYLSDLKKETKELDEVFDLKKRKILLMKAKLVLQKLHTKYNRVHGDINHANFIYDEKKMQAYLIDFDSSLKFGQEVGSTISFPSYLMEYLKYYPFDYLVDIYEFNLQTLVLLARKNHQDILKGIKEGNYPISEKFPEARKLCRELTLTETNKKISGEFIVDYL